MNTEERLERLVQDIKQLSLQMNRDPLLIKKTPHQLLSVLRKKNESSALLSQEEQSHMYIP